MIVILCPTCDDTIFWSRTKNYVGAWSQNFKQSLDLTSSPHSFYCLPQSESVAEMFCPQSVRPSVYPFDCELLIISGTVGPINVKLCKHQYTSRWLCDQDRSVWLFPIPSWLSNSEHCWPTKTYLTWWRPVLQGALFLVIYTFTFQIVPRDKNNFHHLFHLSTPHKNGTQYQIWLLPASTRDTELSSWFSQGYARPALNHFWPFVGIDVKSETPADGEWCGILYLLLYSLRYISGKDIYNPLCSL